jgi:L-gulonate 5-dehydrogenase
MRSAMTLAPGRMRVTEAPEPDVPVGHVLLAVVAVGLCGSDYHLYDGTHPDAHFPHIQGHEFAGRVLELPADHDGSLTVGDLVAVEPLLPCGGCYACRRGRPNCCVQLAVIGAGTEGALSERIAVPRHLLHPTPELEDELAALVEPVSVGLHAFRRSGADRRDTVLVLGGGPIGLSVTLAAADAGCRVIVADRVPSRLEHALAAGAAIVVDSEHEDITQLVLDATQGDGPGAVIDATGAASLISTAVDVVAHAGTVVVVGISTDNLTVPVALLSRKELSLIGARNSVGDFADAVALVRRNAAVVRSWITHRITLDEVPTAIEFAAAHPEVVEKIVVRVGL